MAFKSTRQAPKDGLLRHGGAKAALFEVPYIVATVIAHEVNHWLHPVQFNGQPPREQYINTLLMSEGRAQLAQARFMSVVEGAYPNINSVDLAPGVAEAWEGFTDGGLFYEQAVEQAAQAYGALPYMGTTYAEYLGQLWDQTYPSP